MTMTVARWIAITGQLFTILFVHFSLGIELEGTDFTPFTDAQYRSLCRLVAPLCDTYPLRAIRGHSDIAVERKTDPGPCFDWARLSADARLQPSLLPARARV